jgi:hypothetical protein
MARSHALLPKGTRCHTAKQQMNELTTSRCHGKNQYREQEYQSLLLLLIPALETIAHADQSGEETLAFRPMAAFLSPRTLPETSRFSSFVRMLKDRNHRGGVYWSVAEKASRNAR